METSDFFLLCYLRTGLLTQRNTAAKALGDKVRGAAYYSSVKQEALIKLAFRLMILAWGLAKLSLVHAAYPKYAGERMKGGRKSNLKTGQRMSLIQTL